MIQHIEECIKKNSKGRFSFKSSYPNAISRVNHITVWHPEKRQKVEGKGAASIKYWPSLIILCKGYWVNGARHNDPPLYSVRCGLQYVENGTYWSTKHMANINIDVVFHQIENQQWQDNLAPVLEYPSLECTSLDDFWEKLDHLIGKAVATFTLFLKEKYGLDV